MIRRHLLVIAGMIALAVLLVVSLVVPFLGPAAFALCATGTGSAITAEVVAHVHR